MLIHITHWSTGAILHSVEAPSITAALEQLIPEGADLSEADLTWATLSGANLSGASLTEANLSGADLTRAILTEANLSGANLTEADLARADLTWATLTGATLTGVNLTRANLSGANLTEAILTGAILTGVNLTGAILTGATLSSGESWEEYGAVVVPDLLTAGGHPVPEQAWTCHDWENCPMGAAFGVTSLVQIPLLYRPRVEQFVQFYDALLIHKPQ